ncbi:hypothetical protein WBP07_03925 [Novosphingobium sp. BL-8A]
MVGGEQIAADIGKTRAAYRHRAALRAAVGKIAGMLGEISSE